MTLAKVFTLFLLGVGSTFAVTILETLTIGDGDAVPSSQRPSLPKCVNVVENGQFIGSLIPWKDKSSKDCKAVINTGNIAPFPPVAGGSDGLLTPLQGTRIFPDCSLVQDINFSVESQIIYAQLSWIDRISSNFNEFGKDTFAEISIKGLDNDVSTPVFITTNDNVNPSEQNTNFRRADITDEVQGLVQSDGNVSLALILYEQSFNGPLYFQWDNVELWVCTNDFPVDVEAGGDPHFTTWRGEKFSYHGACDLMLLHSDTFNGGLGLDIHIRTKHRRNFSFIESAAIRIGDEVMEVSGTGRPYYLNGVALNVPDIGKKANGIISDYNVVVHQIDDHRVVYSIDIGHGQHIELRSWRDFVSVKVVKANEADFNDSIGLLGSFVTGQKIGRDGLTVMEDWNAFGQEWQVGEHEPLLFQKIDKSRSSQCKLPPLTIDSRHHRRLGETVSQATANKACANVSLADRDFCMFDVMATGDTDAAMAYTPN